MKVEAVCTSDIEECPTINDDGTRHVQLVEAYKLLPSGRTASDEDGNIIECLWCGRPMIVNRPARIEAQFALGEIVVSPNARAVFGKGLDEQHARNIQVQATVETILLGHAAGQHGHIDAEHRKLNRDATIIEEGKALGQILSLYDVDGQEIWVVTTRERDHTYIFLPSEYFHYIR